MSMSTNLVSGLVSGFDWRSMIDQLIEIEHQRVDLVEDRKSEYESKLTEWQSVNTMLLSLKTAASALSVESAFNVYTSSATSNTSKAASDLLTVSTSSTASPGIYEIKVNNLAKSQKLSSKSYSATDTAISLSAGDILVSGRVVNIAATDTLADIKNKINAVNTGSSPSNVTANIVQYGTNDYRLVLTNDNTGADGISLLNASSSDILGDLGFIETASGSYDIKNSITGGAQSDRFISVNDSIEDLLDLNTPQSSATLKIKGENGSDSDNITIDLSAHNLNQIADAINANKGAANISASVVSETADGNTYYRLQIDGIDDTDPFSDNNNIFQTLGLIKGGVGDVVGDVGTNAMTTNGQVITTSTKLVDIDGYLEYTAGDQILFEGYDTSGSAVNYTFSLSDTKTVQDLLNDIESQYGDVTAAVTADGKIQIVDNTTDTPASSNLSVTFTPTIDKGELDFGFTGAAISVIRDRELVEGKDASIVVDDVTITDPSNTITDVIEGVTLNLVGADDAATTVTVKVERDLSAIKSKIQDMVDSFNTVLGYINTQFSYNDKTDEVGGILFGDGTLASVKSDLINIVTETITGASSDFNKLSLIGITLDLTNTEEGYYQDLTLSIDEDKLTDALETNFDDVRKLFAAFGSSPDANIEYISHTDDTLGGTYDVVITEAATQGTVTGSKALGGDLGEDVTVTIEDFATGRVATVELLAADNLDIDDIVNAINSELAEEYTEILTGDNATGYSSSTMFSDITGADDGDEITFSGTRRSGISVSGSYQIEDAGAETVGDLLEAIEDMFEDEVTASLDANGKIVITDKQAGDSQLTFAINTDSITDLDFGTVSATTEGRYAMPITASNDGGKLVLTHNTYGTGQIALVSQSSATDPLGLDDATSVWGVNVAGTINSITATGSGQTLTVDSDGNDADGLSISYSGTGTPATTFTLTLGIGVLLDRQLGFITDTTDGYVAFKQESLQDSIDSYETRIEQMEAQLNRKMEMMINKFVAMEVALSKIQNQSNWLTGQINASYSGWAGW
ncbi:MAG: flagellar filament capping protein FliD [Deltaproteobacteria bacterium]|nr:flagellar filament capping protein FliD [Deltaproteobacteria bacterium]